MTKVVENGKVAQNVLEEVNITLNKNGIPYEQLSPFKTSGIRVGSPAITSRGMGEAESRKIAELMVQALENHDKPGSFGNAFVGEVKALTDASHSIKKTMLDLYIKRIIIHQFSPK